MPSVFCYISKTHGNVPTRLFHLIFLYDNATLKSGGIFKGDMAYGRECLFGEKALMRGHYHVWK